MFYVFFISLAVVLFTSVKPDDVSWRGRLVHKLPIRSYDIFGFAMLFSLLLIFINSITIDSDVIGVESRIRTIEREESRVHYIASLEYPTDDQIKYCYDILYFEQRQIEKYDYLSKSLLFNKMTSERIMSHYTLTYEDMPVAKFNIRIEE